MTMRVGRRNGYRRVGRHVGLDKGIAQIYNPELGVVERCHSCHVAAE